MSKTLWGFYDGEPFMENPALGLLGVNKPRKGKKMAVRRKKRSNRPRRVRRTRTHHRKNSPRRVRRTRRARRNWMASGMVVPPNPRRRHRRSRRSANPKRRHSRRRHNPAFLGLAVPPIKTVLFAGVGFVGPSMVSGMLNSFAPSIMQQITSFGVAGKYIVKVGSVALLAWAVKKFVGPGQAMAVAIGGGVNVAVSLVNDFAPGILPANPLAMYLPTNPGMRAYVPTRGNLRGMKGPYQLQASNNPNPASVRSIPTAAVAPWALTDASQYGKFGGTASRLFRY